MKDYIRDVDAHWKADSSDFRNGKMVENLSNELNKHPDEKSLIIYGTDHSDFIIRGESGAAIEVA